MIQIFPGKSGRVTFLTLSSFNFMQKSLEILCAVLRISRVTHGQTDRRTFPSLTSTEVENCNVSDWAPLQPDLFSISLLVYFIHEVINSFIHLLMIGLRHSQVTRLCCFNIFYGYFSSTRDTISISTLTSVSKGVTY